MDNLSASRGSKRSFVWKYFVALSKEQIQCSICNTVLTYRDQSTSPMRQHLRFKHPHEFAQNNTPYIPARSGSTPTTLFTTESNASNLIADPLFDNNFQSQQSSTEPLNKVNYHNRKLKLKYKRIPQRMRALESAESDVTSAGRAFLGVLFGADNYRNWMRLKRTSEHPDHHSFVRWLLTLAQSALDNIEENVVNTGGNESHSLDGMTGEHSRNIYVNGALRKPTVKEEILSDENDSDGICLDLDAVEDPQ